MFKQNYNKNKLIYLGMAPCLMFNQAQGEVQKTEDEKPNVLFIIMDDMCDWVNFLGGHEQVITPNLDRLADRGIVFSNAYTAVPLSNPSRAALLTGIQPYVSGIYNNEHEISDFPTANNSLFMPQHFRNNGYKTIMSGKVFHTKPSGMVLNNMWDDKTNMDGGYGPWVVNQTLPPSLQNKWNNFEAWNGPDTDFPDVKNSQKIINFINQSHEKPFFAAMGFYRPHTPYTAPKRYFDMYNVDTIKVPETIPNDLDDLPAYAINNFIRNRNYVNLLKSTDNCYQLMVRAYLACVSFADDRIGMILNALDASRYANNTWIVLVGDNGFHLGQKERWGKSALWREACHVPFIVVPPKSNSTIQAGTCQTPVSLIDIYPTLVEACNLPAVENQLAGNSLMPLLQNTSATWDIASISTYLPGNFVIHQNQWNYIRYANGSHELYNIDIDENEFTNLAGKPEYKHMVDSLAKFLPTSWYTGVSEETVSSVSEDISMPHWEVEISRLNPNYTRPAIGSTFENINSTDRYFNKYSLRGGIVNTKGTPNCAIPGVTHGDAVSALALRLKNDSSGYFELPRMINAGTMTLHVRSGAPNAEGYISIQHYDSEDWTTLAWLKTKKQTDFSDVSIDEIITYDINMNEEVKLRIRGGNKFTQIFRVDVTPYGVPAAVHQHKENFFSLHGRKLIVNQTTRVIVFNTLGVKVLENQVDKEWLLPDYLGNGFFVVQSEQQTHKILLKN